MDAHGTDLAARLPELAGLAVRVAARSAVLDGELVVVDAHGRADDDALRERLAGRPGRPVAYLVFDLLHLDGRWLLGQPLDKRRAALRRVLRPGDEVVVVPAITGEGLRAARGGLGAGDRGHPRRDGARRPYLPGVRSTLWRAIPAAAPGEAGPAAVRTGQRARSRVARRGTAPVLALFRRLPFAGGARAHSPGRLSCPGATRTNVRTVGGCPYISTPAR